MLDEPCPKGVLFGFTAAGLASSFRFQLRIETAPTSSAGTSNLTVLTLYSEGAYQQTLLLLTDLIPGAHLDRLCKAPWW